MKMMIILIYELQDIFVCLPVLQGQICERTVWQAVSAVSPSACR